MHHVSRILLTSCLAVALLTSASGCIVFDYLLGRDSEDNAEKDFEGPLVEDPVEEPQPQCPVTNEYVYPQSAVAWLYQQKLYYFRDEQALALFKDNPEKYLAGRED